MDVKYIFLLATVGMRPIISRGVSTLKGLPTQLWDELDLSAPGCHTLSKYLRVVNKGRHTICDPGWKRKGAVNSPEVTTAQGKGAAVSFPEWRHTLVISAAGEARARRMLSSRLAGLLSNTLSQWERERERKGGRDRDRDRGGE